MADVRRRLFFFSHLQKAGGTTVEAVMRRNLGVRHMLVNPPRGWVYRPEHLATDLAINPTAISLASHWLRPFVDFGEHERHITWYTVLRDPLDRVASHYQHHVEKMGVSRPFLTWIRNPNQQNWMTRLFAGEVNLARAKEILATRYAFIGLLERFDESLVLMRWALDLPGLQLGYGRPRNTAVSSSRRDAIRQLLEENRDQVKDLNRLDVELFDFARSQLFPDQVRRFGGEAALRAEVASERLEDESSARDRVRNASNAAYRRLVYLPLWRLRREVARLRGVPDERW